MLYAITNSMYDLAYIYLNNLIIFVDRMPLYTRKCHDKCGLLPHAWGYIDGILRKICRPTYFQRQAYSGHKHCHRVKFHSALTPN